MRYSDADDYGRTVAIAREARGRIATEVIFMDGDRRVYGERGYAIFNFYGVPHKVMMRPIVVSGEKGGIHPYVSATDIGTGLAVGEAVSERVARLIGGYLETSESLFIPFCKVDEFVERLAITKGAGQKSGPLDDALADPRGNAASHLRFEKYKTLFPEHLQRFWDGNPAEQGDWRLWDVQKAIFKGRAISFTLGSGWGDVYRFVDQLPQDVYHVFLRAIFQRFPEEG